jgi:hypothetical protein
MSDKETAKRRMKTRYRESGGATMRKQTEQHSDRPDRSAVPIDRETVPVGQRAVHRSTRSSVKRAFGVDHGKRNESAIDRL